MSFGTSRSFTIDPATSDDSSALSVSSTLTIIYYVFFFLEDSKRQGRVLNGKYGCILTFCLVTRKEL